MKSMTSFTLLLAVVVLFGWGCTKIRQDQNQPPEINREEILFDAKQSGLIMNDEEILRMATIPIQLTVQGNNPQDVSDFLFVDIDGWKSAALADVTGGGSFGLAFLEHKNSQFTFIAKMGNLPEPIQGAVYQGWLVKRGETMSVIPVGNAIRVGEQLVNVFVSSTDISDHAFYVLTLEEQPDDFIPEEHILEGAFN